MFNKYIYPWLVLILLCGAYFFHQADRALFGLLTDPIQQDLGLSNGDIGWINTALSWTLAFMTMIAGFAGDRLPRKWLITVSLIFWSLMTVCMGFVGGFVSVLFFRSIATGGGESFYGPSAMALLASHHKRTRSIAFSIHQSAIYVGLMSSGVLTALALRFFGHWRFVFIVFGAAGLFLGILFIFALHEKREDEGIAVAKNHQTFIEFLKGLAVSLWAFIGNPSALLATTGFVAIVFVNNAYLFWAPKFMIQKFAVDVSEAGTQMMFWHHFAALAAILVGGVVTDIFVTKMPRFRLMFQIVALLAGAPCLYLIGESTSVSIMLMMTAAYGIFRGFFEVNTHASVFDVVPPRHRATVVGCMIMCAFFFGGFSGVLMGKLSDLYGVRGFEIGFLIMAASYVVAALLMMISFFFTFKRNAIIYSQEGEES